MGGWVGEGGLGLGVGGQVMCMVCVCVDDTGQGRRHMWGRTILPSGKQLARTKPATARFPASAALTRVHVGAGARGAALAVVEEAGKVGLLHRLVDVHRLVNLGGGMGPGMGWVGE